MNRPRMRSKRWRFYDEAERMYDLDYAFQPDIDQQVGNFEQQPNIRNRPSSRQGQPRLGRRPQQGYAYRYQSDRDRLNSTNLEDFGRGGNYENMGEGPYARGFDYDWEGEPYTPEFTYIEFWNVPGPYAGIGPQGYQRSDERILEDVYTRLSRNGQLDASGIKADSLDRQVTLSGTVRSRRDKSLAENLVSTIPGVIDVQNDLRVEGHPGRDQNRLDQEGNQRQGSSQNLSTGSTSISSTSQRSRTSPPSTKSTTGSTGTRASSGGQQGSQTARVPVNTTKTSTPSRTGLAASKDNIHKDMVVVSKDGTQIGTVKEVRTNDFLVDRPLAFDIYIPFNAVDVTGNTVRVQVNYDQIDHQGWDKPI